MFSCTKKCWRERIGPNRAYYSHLAKQLFANADSDIPTQVFVDTSLHMESSRDCSSGTKPKLISFIPLVGSGIPTQETRLCDASLQGKPIVLMLNNVTPIQDLGLQPLEQIVEILVSIPWVYTVP